MAAWVRCEHMEIIASGFAQGHYCMEDVLCGSMKIFECAYIKILASGFGYRNLLVRMRTQVVAMDRACISACGDTCAQSVFSKLCMKINAR